MSLIVVRHCLYQFNFKWTHVYVFQVPAVKFIISHKCIHIYTKKKSNQDDYSRSKPAFTKKITSISSKYQQFSSVIVAKLTSLKPYERVLSLLMLVILTFVMFVGKVNLLLFVTLFIKQV